MAATLGCDTIEHTNGTDALTIDSSGNVSLSQVGSGTFYRSGTWTPVFTSTGATDNTATIYSGTNQVEFGEYTRIGDLVHANFNVKVSSSTPAYTNGGADGQRLIVTGLPFTIRNQTDYYPASTVGYMASWTGWTASYSPHAIGHPNTKQVHFYYVTTNTTADAWVNYLKTANAQLIGSITYRTDDA